MSTYERYDEAAAHFDAFRGPEGVEIIAGCLTRLDRPLSDVSLLDAGCGSGNYTAELVNLVGRIDAVDVSDGMLDVARGKLADMEAAGRVAFLRASVDDLPFEDGRFDAVMVNQVLHHLETGDDAGYGGHHRALAEIHRVLRPGGLAVINACTHEQIREGCWYYHLVPDALEAVLARCAPERAMVQVLATCGLRLEGRIVPLNAVMLGAAYFELCGPLDRRWRSGDSIWALAGRDGTARAEAKVRALDAEGRLEAYFREHDARRPRVGQITFYVARKPA